MVRFNDLKRFLFLIILVGAIAINFKVGENGIVFAGDNAQGDNPTPEVEVVNPYFTIEHITLEDGTTIEKSIINGPPNPLPGYEDLRTVANTSLPRAGVIADFPSYSWVFGCSAVSGAMIAAYYDRSDYTNIYAGPTNGSVMPLTDEYWLEWSDGYDLYPNNPLVASHIGVDGRTTKGSIDDYWVSYLSDADDPYIGNWPQHAWSDAIGDFMKTSQSVYDIPDGATIFFNSGSSKLTCDTMEYNTYDGVIISNMDGTYGRKLFYEARGYSVNDCYNQKTDNKLEGGFSLADFKNEIDAGHPVLLNLTGHSVVGYGYNEDTIYFRNTWDNNPNNTYSMVWTGSYLGMVLESVSIVRLAPITPPPPAPTGVSATDGTFSDKVVISWSDSATADDYRLYRNTIDSPTGAAELIKDLTTNSYDDTSVVPGEFYYYWVKACNSGGCSDYSKLDTGFALEVPEPPTDLTATDGAFTDRVQISWTSSDGAAYYQVYRNTSNSPGDATMLEGKPTSSFFEDNSVVQGEEYFYWVQGCNLAGCSDFSSSDSGYAANKILTPSVPTNVDASDGMYMDRVRISWESVERAAYYEVYRTDSDSPPGSGALPLIDKTLTVLDDFSAAPNTDYYYWVRACNSAGCSDVSNYDLGWRQVYFNYLPLVIR